MSRQNLFITTVALLISCVVTAVPRASTGNPGSANANGESRYLVVFEEPGLLEQAARSPGRRFDPRSPELVTARAQLRARHSAHRQEIAAALARPPEVTHHFHITRSGMGMRLTASEAERLRRLPGVASVQRERVDRLQTYSGPWFIGAESVWNGDGAPAGIGTRGGNTVVGIIDTGIDPDHPSFADDESCGHGVDGAPGKLLSSVDCSLTDLDGRCIGPLPLDTQGHGSHVASTAAGNHLPATTDPAPQPFGEPVEISGVAPCARIRSYKGCPDLLCPALATEAAMNNILLDGDVDVMNFSISGGNDPWEDGDRLKLDLVAAGVLVAAAAGNTSIPPLGPDDPVGEVNHNGPWVLTVAATTHDGGDLALPILSADGPESPPPGTRLIPLSKGSMVAVGEVPDAQPFALKPIRRPVDDPLQIDGDHGCTGPFTPGFYSGAVAMVLAGSSLLPACTFEQQVQFAQAAGADMVVIRNNSPGGFSFTLITEPSVPAYSISMAAGEALVDWIEQHPGATVRLDLVAGQGTGDVLADFSLRGPTPAPLRNLTKPDVATPGVSIYAAAPGVSVGGIPLLPGGYQFMSGTSMASPHAAGAAALVKSARPDWTATEIKSAMMLTAFNGGTREDEETPWDADDVGSGRVDLTRAALAGLVMDETFENFLAADPTAGGDVRTLNLPALRDMDCIGSCTWTRTVRNTLEVPSQWEGRPSVVDGEMLEITIEPEAFAFTGDLGETQEITFTVTPSGPLLDAVAFGEVVLSEDGELSPDLRITVAVMGSHVADDVYRDRFEAKGE